MAQRRPLTDSHPRPPTDGPTETDEATGGGSAVRYFLTRLGQAVLTMVTAVVISFALFQAMPGGPVEAMRSQIIQNRGLEAGGTNVNMEQLRRLVESYSNMNPEDPFHVQLLDYSKNIFVEGDLGTSIYRGEPVTSLILQRLPWTTFIGVYAMVIGYLASFLIGSMMAYKEKSRFDSVLSVVLTALNSVPYYIVGVVLIFVVGVKFGLLPIGGRVGSGVDPAFTVEFFASAAAHAALPILSIAALLTNTALTLRENAVRVLGEDFMRVAKLRGINDARMATRYVGHNAILPMYTKIMIGVAGIFSGTVIVEQVFSYPGMGLLLFDAVKTRDYPLLMGTMIFFTAITVTAILVADITYGFLDPRIGAGDADG